MNCIVTLPMLPCIAQVFSILFIFHELYIQMQNLLNWDRPGLYRGQPKKHGHFSGINGTLPAQTMPIPVTTDANRDATSLHWGSTGLTPGLIGGVFNALSLSWWRHGRCGCRPGLPRYLTAFLVTPVDSQLFSTS